MAMLVFEGIKKLKKPAYLQRMLLRQRCRHGQMNLSHLNASTNKSEAWNATSSDFWIPLSTRLDGQFFFVWFGMVDILNSRDRFRQASLAYVRQLQEDQVLATTEAVDMPSCGMSTETLYDRIAKISRSSLYKISRGNRWIYPLGTFGKAGNMNCRI